MKTKLVANALPAVLLGTEYVVFSPYSQSLALVDEERIDDPETLSTLQQDGFLGTPLSGGPGDHSPFYDLTLVVTGDCNLRCKYCFAKGGDDARYMAREVAELAVRHAICTNPKKALSVNFFGGEPSLCGGLLRFVVDLVESQCPYEYQFGITTNGVFASSFTDFLVQQAFRVTISADGPPQIQDAQRPLQGGGRSSPVMERNIRQLVRSVPHVMVRATVTDMSVDHLNAAVAYFAELGIEVIQFEPLSVAGRASELESTGCQRPDATRFARSLKEALAVGEQYGVEIVSTAWMNLLQPSCHFCDGIGGNRFVVNYDGSISACLEVQSCTHPLGESFIVGNIDPQRGVVLSQEKIAKVRSQIITERNPECLSCFAKPVCAGGCPARNAHRTGDTCCIDPYFCQINQEMLSHLIVLMAEENGLISVNYPALPAASPPLEDGACDCPRRPHGRSPDVTFGWLTAALPRSAMIAAATESAGPENPQFRQRNKSLEGRLDFET